MYARLHIVSVIVLFATGSGDRTAIDLGKERMYEYTVMCVAI